MRLPASLPQAPSWVPYHSGLKSQAPGSLCFAALTGLHLPAAALLSLVHISAGWMCKHACLWPELHC